MSTNTTSDRVDAGGLQAIIAEAARRASEGGHYTREEAIAAGAELGLHEADVIAAWEGHQRQLVNRRRRLRNNRALLVGSAVVVILGIFVVGAWRALSLSSLSSAAAAFEGSWDTTWGRLELVGQPPTNRLEGRYSYDVDGRMQAGVLKGVVNGNVFKATWLEQRPDGRHTGPAQFELQPGGQAFKGAWGDNTPPDPDGAWSGTRVKGLTP